MKIGMLDSKEVELRASNLIFHFHHLQPFATIMHGIFGLCCAAMGMGVETKHTARLRRRRARPGTCLSKSVEFVSQVLQNTALIARLCQSFGKMQNLLV